VIELAQRRKGRQVKWFRWFFAQLFTFILFVLADAYSFVYVPTSEHDYMDTKLARVTQINL
jgi:hypothetical protein